MKRFFNAVREMLSGKPLAVRSPQWKTTRKNFLKANRTCAACGGNVALEVHHIKPFHLFKELELDPTNLITLCENPTAKCHLTIGHNGNWKRENIRVIEDAKASLEKILK